MLIIFNYGPQSSWERGTGGKNRFLKDGGPHLHQFFLKSLHGWVGRGAGLGIQDWPAQEVQRVKVRALWRPDFLAYEWGGFHLNPGLGDLESVRGCSVLLQGPGNSELLGSASWPRATSNLPKCRRCSAGSSIWRLVTILPSVDDEEA